uniref:Ig-like domain-containing protein n=1 Tax=Cyprinus carpio TaxID=7962 RepID=A0A8C2F347_CYPCA
TIGPNKDTNMIKREGESVTLSCTYDTNNDNIFLYWYRQYPNTEPQYLLRKGARSYGGEQKTDQRFQPATSQTSTELTIDSVTLSDSALYYCALTKLYKNSHTVIALNYSKQKCIKTQKCQYSNPLKHVSDFEGESVTLDCKYTTVSPSQELFWYIQRTDTSNNTYKLVLLRNSYGGGIN